MPITPKKEPQRIGNTVTIGVQVDGKLRGAIQIPRDVGEETAYQAALSLPNVVKHLEERRVQKLIYRTNRVVGIVTAPRGKAD